MGCNEKPIINITMFIKVRYLFSINPFNKVPNAHNWYIIPCSIWKELNLLDTPPWSNWSALICLPNKLFDSALNSMNLSKASGFLYTHPNLEYLSIKWSNTNTSHIWTQKGSYTWVCTNSKHSLVPCPLKNKWAFWSFYHLYKIRRLKDLLE